VGLTVPVGIGAVVTGEPAKGATVTGTEIGDNVGTGAAVITGGPAKGATAVGNVTGAGAKLAGAGLTEGSR